MSYQDTIKRLHEKLDTVPALNEEETSVSTFHLKQKDAMEKLRIFKNKNEKNTRIIAQDLAMIQESLQKMDKASLKNNELEAQLMQSTERWVQQEMNQNIERAKAFRKEKIELITKTYKNLKANAVDTIHSEFQDLCKQNLVALESRIDEVTEILQHEKGEKEDVAAQLVEVFGDEILKLQNIISQQRQQRKKSHLNLLNLLDQIDGSMEVLLVEERREREKFESHISGKLEEVCYTLEAKILGKQ